MKKNQLQFFTKRCFDVIAVILIFVGSLPLIILISVLIKLTSKGPVLVRLNWIGFQEKPFHGYKFRTMVDNAAQLKDSLLDKNEMTGPVFKIKNDPRITALGKVLRKYSLDELPQLWNVFKGEMSLIGPRPPLTSEYEKYEEWHKKRLLMKPGITCIWQVSGRNIISDFDDWVRCDLYYIEHWSLWLDFKIFCGTIVSVLRGTGV